MKRAHLLSVIAILLAAVAAAGAARAVAQDGTPAVEPVAIETLARGVPAGTGGRTLLLQRIVIQPGVEIPSHRHPADLAYVIESGSFSFTVLLGKSHRRSQAARGARVTVWPSASSLRTKRRSSAIGSRRLRWSGPRSW